MKHANIPVFVPHVGCPNQCSFCNQRTISGEHSVPDAAAVTRICTDALGFLGERAKTAQLAFFGGSFTAIARPLMLELLEAAEPFVSSGQIGGGIRISTRPDAIDEERLALLRCYGVKVIELGAQSMDGEVLRLNLRGHTTQAVRDAAELVRRSGFELVLQMMTGLYGDTEEKTMETAQKLAALRPDAVRIYPTVVIRGTMLAELYEQGRYTPPAADEAVRVSAKLLAFFDEMRIPVIRVGLHASRELERDMLAGGYHPALRELCESRLFLEKFLAHFDLHPEQQGRVLIRVPSGCLSKAMGQHKMNLATLGGRGIRAHVAEDKNLFGYEFEITCRPVDE